MPPRVWRVVAWEGNYGFPAHVQADGPRDAIERCKLGSPLGLRLDVHWTVTEMLCWDPAKGDKSAFPEEGAPAYA